MQHNFNIRHQGIPTHSLEQLDHAVAVLNEHFDDVIVAVTHSETRNIKVISSNPYAGLGMLSTIQQSLKDSIDQSEFHQWIMEQSQEEHGL